MKACQLCFLLLGLIGASYGQQENIVKLAEKLGATTLLKFVTDAGLADTLSGPGPFTVFAPTNDAFAALPAEIVAVLQKDKKLLRKVLEFHVTSGRAYSSALSNDLLVQSLDDSLKIRVNIYTVDTKPVVTVDGSKVVLVDQNATNGVIHVIDKVMFPLPIGDIPEEVSKSEKLSTLLTAVKKGGLAGALSGEGPFTLFAPNDAAFDKLPAGTLAGLLANVTALDAVLKYHVVPATAYSAGLSSGMVPTLNGAKVNVMVSSAGVSVNGAKVILADVPAANGVIHEIDTVLIPPTL